MDRDPAHRAGVSQDHAGAWQALEPSARAQRRLVARLAARLGLRHLALAEDAVQTAVLRALERWPAQGVPDQPEAWLYRVAHHAAIDVLRREAGHEAWPDDAEDPDGASTSMDPLAVAPPPSRFSSELDDDELALLFAACHPSWPQATQVAMALRTLAGLALGDVACAMLSTEAAIAQRLARARSLMAGEPLVVPAGEALPARRDSVLTVLSLMFLAAQRGDVGPVGPAPSAPQESHQRIRQACWEAIRLARAVATHPACAHPDADALAALLLFHGARLTGRLDDAGEIVPLPGQARDRWDAGMLRLGLHHLRRAQRAARLSRWHLQAGIAAEHALAPSYAATDWPAIVRHYDALLRIDASASPSLGHAIALVESGQARSGLDRLMALLPDVPSALKAHTLAAVAQAEQRLGLFDEARQHLQQAVLAAPRPADARMLARRLALLQTPVATGPEPAEDGTLRRAPGR